MEIMAPILIILALVVGIIIGRVIGENAIHCDPTTDELEEVLMHHHHEDGEFNYEGCAWELRGIFKHGCNPIRYKYDCLKQKCARNKPSRR